MLVPTLVILAACVVLGLCWYGANGGTLPVSQSERQHWKRVAERSRTMRPASEIARLVSPVPQVERPAPEPWLTADELFHAAQAAAERELADLSAEVDAMLGHLSRDRPVEP